MGLVAAEVSYRIHPSFFWWTLRSTLGLVFLGSDLGSSGHEGFGACWTASPFPPAPNRTSR
jgi:hypothetical protein